MRRARVYLIGAGPGDPELMTLKAVRALASADVVLVDDLVNRGCLAHVRYGAQIIEVGKRGGCPSTSQEFIQRLMLRLARRGWTVARLKGGDPFVFGRGGEELQALAAAGIPVEVIPGLTAGTAVPATLGIPVTHRALARGVVFVAGHTTDDAEPDWRALAGCAMTLVVYMGLARLGHIAGRLIAAGMAPDTPACAIQHGTLAHQRHVVSALSSLEEQVRARTLASPTIVVIGEVVRLAGDLQAVLRRAA